MVKDREVVAKLGRLNRRAMNVVGPLYLRSLQRRGGEKMARLQKAVQWQADHFDDILVVVAACLKGVIAPWPPIATSSAYGSIYPAVQNLLLGARAAGLGAALITVPLWSKFLARRALGLPWNVTPCAVIPLGWPIGKYGPTTRRPVGEAVSLDRYGNRAFLEVGVAWSGIALDRATEKGKPGAAGPIFAATTCLAADRPNQLRLQGFRLVAGQRGYRRARLAPVCQHLGMSARTLARIVGIAVVATWALIVAPVTGPAASADPCSDIAVVFARGTHQDPGLGNVGQAFVDSLSSQVGGRSVGVYAVNYPANDDYHNSATAGSNDASAHIQDTVASCPDTKIVLGGYSQGATVIDLSTSQMPPDMAEHVAAVALFGEPTSGFSSMLWGGQPLPTINPAYGSKTLSLCAPDDPICTGGGNIMAHVSYIESGMTNQAATFAANRLN